MDKTVKNATTSLRDKMPSNVYSTVKLDRKRGIPSPMENEIRRHPVKDNEDSSSTDSRLPLMMAATAGCTSPHTYTNTTLEHGDGGGHDNADSVMMQSLSSAPPGVHNGPVVVAKNQRSLNKTDNSGSAKRSKQCGQQAKQQEEPGSQYVLSRAADTREGAAETGAARDYAVPSSLYRSDYVEEDEDNENEKDEGEIVSSYLTPTEFPQSAFPFDNKAGLESRVVSASGSEKEAPQRSLDEKPFRPQRFDSGVGDCDNSFPSTSTPSMSSAGSLSNPRMSTNMEQHYEDIDIYSKDYKRRRENLRKGRESTVKPPKVNGIDHPSPPSVDLSGVTLSESGDLPPTHDTNTRKSVPNAQERRHDDGTIPHTYSRLNMMNGIAQKETAESRSCGRCYVPCVIIFVFIISIASLAISLFLLISRENEPQPIFIEPGKSSPLGSANLTLIEDLNVLKSEVEYLKSENINLKNKLERYQDNSSHSIQSLQDEVKIIKMGQKTASIEFQEITNRIRSEIANISLTPGPQGPQGVGNFSLCQLKSVSASLAASEFHSTETDFAPATDVLEEKVTLFAFCTYSGATKAVLDYKIVDSKIQYKCICSGKINDVPRTTCTITCFVCPRLNLHVS